jgi:hypothetical protein
MTAVKRIFTVNGKPFFPIGGQSCNSSGYNDKESETAFKIVKMLHGNTLEIPVYWDKVEPKEGTFDFTAVDALIASARRNEIKLILLWFATWKNGNMDYTPAWVKTNPQHFKRVISPTGKDIWNLSSHCQANLEADKKAFTELCKHLKAVDGTEQTVIGLQIENESGILGSDRDYGPEAQAIYDSPVPAKLVNAMKKAGKGLIYDIWQKAGGKTSGTWPQMFDWEAGELMTAWGIAKYIDAIAESAKAVYDIPMYDNVWLMEQNWWSMPGESYPSGGAVTKVIDIYKWFTPHLDVIAPDNYQLDTPNFKKVCAAYARDDNPLFMPETIGNQNMFHAIAEYNSIGNFFFGLEFILAQDGTVRPECQTIVDSMWCTAAIAPLLLKYQGSGRVYAATQDGNVPSQLLDMEGFTGFLEFGDKRGLWAGTDWRHRRAAWLGRTPAPVNPAYALLIQSSKHEFYMVGANCRLYLRPKVTLAKMQPQLAMAEGAARTFAYIVSVDEGHFDKNGKFVVDRTRNGDEIGHRGLWVEPDISVLRVITCD